MEGLNRNGEQLIYLISCALRGAQAREDVMREIDLSGLFALAQNHSVTAMVCTALEKTDAFSRADGSVKKQWLEAKNKAIRKNLLLEVDQKALMAEMGDAGIWHVPLKGSILKDWYPQYGMREMADIDILFDPTRREQVRQIFLRHGYSAEHYQMGNHDIYTKLPVYNFEMHVALFNEGEYEELADKYTGVAERLIPDEGGKCRFRFTPEDFYVFILAHAHKHYSHGGTGIRTLVDIYVMNHAIGQTMNWDDVAAQLEDLGIWDYEKCSRILTEKIFGCDRPVSEAALTAEERDMILNMLEMGTYGTLENRINNRLHALQADDAPITGRTKLKYCMERLFPGRRWFIDKYPFVYRHPWLMPAFWMWRICKKLPAAEEKVRRELSVLKSHR